MDIVEVQVGEITGELTEFSEGETILTLNKNDCWRWIDTISSLPTKRRGEGISV